MANEMDFEDTVDIMIPANFKELITAKNWIERKEALEKLLTLISYTVRIDQEADYHEIVEILSKIIAKDVNINVCAVATKCVIQLVNSLQTKFGPYVSIVTPVIFEKLKEKNVVLRDPLVEALDALYSTSKLEAMSDDIVAALEKRNSNVKIQTNQFLCRVFKTFDAQTAPKRVIRKLTPFIEKCTGEADHEARESSYAALGAMLKALGKTHGMAMLTEVLMDKRKMERIQMFYNGAVEEDENATGNSSFSSSFWTFPERIAATSSEISSRQPPPKVLVFPIVTLEYSYPPESFFKECCEGKLELKFDREKYLLFSSAIKFNSINRNSKPVEFLPINDNPGFECFSLLLTFSRHNVEVIQKKINKQFVIYALEEEFDGEKIVQIIGRPHILTDEHLETIARWFECKIMVYFDGEWEAYGKWNSGEENVPTFVLEKKRSENDFIYQVVLSLKND